MTRGTVRWALAALLASLGAASCFSPREPACAFSCATDGTCPPAYACGSDNLCHRQDGVGLCLFGPADGGAD